MLFRFEDFSLDSDRRELRRGADLVPIEPQVFDLLVHLVRNRDRVVSKDDMIAAVWGGRIVSESALTNRINAARTAVSIGANARVANARRPRSAASAESTRATSAVRVTGRVRSMQYR